MLRDEDQIDFGGEPDSKAPHGACVSSVGGVVQAPDVAVVGFIPWVAWPRRGFRFGGRRTLWTLAFVGLHTASSNPAPPSEFAGLHGLDRYLDGREFRGCALVRELRLQLGTATTPARVQAIGQWAIGFTPLPRGVHYERGYGDGTPSVTWNQDSVTVGLELSFRIGRFADRLTEFVFKNPAPYARLQIDYTLRQSGAFEVTYRGTCIPSFSCYQAGKGASPWKLHQERSMLGVDQTEVEAFVTAPERAPFLPEPFEKC